MAVPTYLVIDLEIAKHVLTKDFSYFTDRGFYTNEKVLTSFSVGNPKWRNLRVKMSPAFTSGKLKGMFQTLVNNGSNLGNFLEKNIDGITGLVDIKQALAYYTIDNIGSCAFGLDCNSFEIPNSPFKKHGDNFFVPGNVQAFKTAFNMNFPKIARTLGLRDVPRNVSDFFMSMVKDAVAYREKNNYTKKDFLQSLIEMKNNPDALQNGHKGTVVL
ncbi:hypothetical protein NQ314_021350 [Rhamnusium bicolor]|uniref:Cytochrome P450 n=1 Tax=Rhamnusium bicolor TaxID=1586634 RepID=A0AAV8WKG4_9CUCU|nr:hypothetical protein NQ314_021350 [Rhamnusium bicolor]